MLESNCNIQFQMVLTGLINSNLHKKERPWGLPLCPVGQALSTDPVDPPYSYNFSLRNPSTEGPVEVKISYISMSSKKLHEKTEWHVYEFQNLPNGRHQLRKQFQL